MNKNAGSQLLELDVEKLTAHAAGLSRVNGEVILTKGVLPGERISVSLMSASKGVRWGRLEKIETPSPHRISPPCPLAANGVCGACDFSHVEPSVALSLKTQAALGDLADNYKITPEYIQSPLNSRYRRRALFHLGLSASGKKLAVGYHDKKRRIVEFHDCLVVPKEINQAVAALNEWASNLDLTVGGAEIHIFAGSAKDEGLLITFAPAPPRSLGHNKAFVKQSNLSNDLMKAIEALTPLLKNLNYAVFIQKNFRAAPQLISGNRGLTMLTALSLPHMGLRLLAGPLVFTQINPCVNALMIDLILSKSSPLAPGRALDLYCGLGNISFPLMKKGFNVWGVESSSSSLSAAQKNARGEKNINFINGDSASVCRDLSKKGEKFNIVVLDPPRAGAKDLAPAIASLEPEKILYVSCHPACLARDLPAFVSLGYSLDSLHTLDMFPGTSHLETVACLKR